MIPTLHPATASLPEPEAYVRLAARYGFHGVDHSAGYWARWVETTSLAYVQEYCENLDCAIVHGALPVNARDDDATYRSDMRDLPRIAAIMESLGVKVMSTWLSPVTMEPPQIAGPRLAIRLREIAAVLSDHRIRLGLEFIGPKTARAKGFDFVCDLSGASDLAQEVGDSCGLLLDSYHWHSSGGTVEDIMMLQPERILHVHINDSIPGPLETLHERKRLLPGAGAIDLQGFLGAIARNGYDGAVAVETYSDTLNAAGPEEAARLAGETTLRTLHAFL